MEQPQVPSQQQLQQLLLKAFSDKADAEAKVKEADTQISALRSVLAGYQMAAQAAAATPTPPTT